MTAATLFTVTRSGAGLVTGAAVGGYSAAHGWLPLGLGLCFVIGALLALIPNPFETRSHR